MKKTKLFLMTMMGLLIIASIVIATTHLVTSCITTKVLLVAHCILGISFVAFAWLLIAIEMTVEDRDKYRD